MDGFATTSMVPDPAALGVKVKVVAAVPLGVRVVGEKVPEMPAAAGVRTTLDGQAAPVGVMVRVTALPTVPELDDKTIVKAVATEEVAAGVGVGATTTAFASKTAAPADVAVKVNTTGAVPVAGAEVGENVPCRGKLP